MLSAMQKKNRPRDPSQLGKFIEKKKAANYGGLKNMFGSFN